MDSRLGKLGFEVATEGWKFPAPALDAPLKPPANGQPRPKPPTRTDEPERARPRTRPWPTGETVMFKDRLLYLLQPPLANVFAGKQIQVPAQPFPYQLEGIAFLMPRHAALLADEMGLGKTAQAILALRLLFQAGMIRRGAARLPEAAGLQLVPRAANLGAGHAVRGDRRRHRDPRAAWLVSNCPLKLVNYELLTRDADFIARRTCSLRRGRARRGPADQEPRVEDGPGGARACSASAAGR